MKSVYKAEADESRLYPMGLTEIPGGIHVSFASPASSCALLLYRKGRKASQERIPFPQEGRIGDVWSMTIRGSFADREYTFEADGKEVPDPYGKSGSLWPCLCGAGALGWPGTRQPGAQGPVSGAGCL